MANGQGTAATSWWNDSLLVRATRSVATSWWMDLLKWEFELTDLSIELLTEQNGLLIVGDWLHRKESNYRIIY